MTVSRARQRRRPRVPDAPADVDQLEHDLASAVLRFRSRASDEPGLVLVREPGPFDPYEPSRRCHVISGRAREASRARRAQPHGLVFATATGTLLNDANVRNRWHRPAVKKAGLDSSLRVHDLRHTYGTLTTACGAGMHFAGQQLGHRDPRSTMRYLHVDPEAHREAPEKAAAWRRRSAG